jgi:hypothetical protein
MDNSRHAQGHRVQALLLRFALPTVIGAGCLLHAGLAAAQLINFSDSFTPPSTLWSNSGWTASGGQYSALIPNNSPLALTMLPFNFSSDNFQLTVTVNQLGDGGIFFQAPNPTNSVLFVDGGLGYGQGIRNGQAGQAAYWGTASNPQINLNPGAFLPGDAYTLTLTDIGGTLSAYSDVHGSFDSSSLLLTTFVDPALTSFQIGLYDDQPNTTPGSNGFGAPQSFSNLSVSGTASVPEPGTLGLLCLGLAGVGFFRRRRLH